MSSFELYMNSGRPIQSIPVVSIQQCGKINISRAAFKLLGEPRHVELLFDHVGRRIGLRAPREATVASHKVSVTQGGNFVHASRFLRDYGIDSTTRRYRAQMEANTLVIDLLSESVKSGWHKNKLSDSGSAQQGKLTLLPREDQAS